MNFTWAGLAWPLNEDMKAMVCLPRLCVDWAQPEAGFHALEAPRVNESLGNGPLVTCWMVNMGIH